MTDSRSGTSRFGLILGAIAALAFVLAPLAASIGVLSPMTAFSAFGLGGLLGVLTLGLAVITAVRNGFASAAPSLALGAAITGVFLLLAFPARHVPRINDITTDTQNPPQFVQASNLPDNAGRDMSYPRETFAQQQQAGYPDLQPLRMAEPPAVVFERVAAAAGAMPQWEVTRTDPSAFVLEGVSTSRLFRFKDDFVIEVRPANGGSMIHMRSKSRDGRGDVGANAARIEAFFAKLR